MWNTDNTCGQTIAYPFAGSYAIVDSSCTETGQDELYTESFDTVSCNIVRLAFSNQYYWYSGNIGVDLSSDGGKTWINSLYLDANDGYPTPDWKNIDISSIADTANVQIRFNYLNNTTDGFWAIDNVQVLCESNQLQFSSQTYVPSSPQQIMIVNGGAGSLSINMINIEGSDASDFSIGGNDSCSNQTLLPAETCMVDIVFTPASAGLKSAYLSIYSNDPDTPILNISLAGFGTDSD